MFSPKLGIPPGQTMIEKRGMVLQYVLLGTLKSSMLKPFQKEFKDALLEVTFFKNVFTDFSMTLYD